MTTQQTIDIPSDRRVVLELPETEEPYVCPYCGKTEHIPNAKTIAAFEEADAMLRGEIPAKWYDSVDEMWDDLHK